MTDRKQIIRIEQQIANLEQLLAGYRAELAQLTAKPTPKPDPSLQREITCAGCREPIAASDPCALILVSESFEPGVAALKTKQPVHLEDSCLQKLSERRPVGQLSEILKSWSNPEFHPPRPCKNCGRVLAVEKRGRASRYCSDRCRVQFGNRTARLRKSEPAGGD